MTHIRNAHGNGAPDAALPKFSVNVVPTDQLRREDLGTMLNLYRRGETTPLIFGDDNKPEAAIIPFAAFVRLMKYDFEKYGKAAERKRLLERWEKEVNSLPR